MPCPFHTIRPDLHLPVLFCLRLPLPAVTRNPPDPFRRSLSREINFLQPPQPLTAIHPAALARPPAKIRIAMAIDHVLTPTQLEVLNHLLEGPTVSRAARSRRSTAPPSMFGSRRKTRRSALSMNAPTPSSPPPPPTASVSSTSRRLTPSKNRSAVPIPRPPSAFAPPSMCWAAAPDDPTQTGTRRAVVLSAAPRVSETWYEADDGPSLRYAVPFLASLGRLIDFQETRPTESRLTSCRP